MINIYGTIGYTHLNNTINDIIVLSDMHDKLEKCTNYIKISDWLKKKFKSSVILLEEVDRDENSNLEELWLLGEHTQELKKIYLENNKIIEPIDIRPLLILFNWELFNKNDYNKDYDNCELYKYLNLIDIFFCLKNKYCLKKLKEKYTFNYLKINNLGKHYLKIKYEYNIFLNKYKIYLNYTIKYLYNTNITILENINDILNNIMEWYSCAMIDINNNKPIIIHTGLYHSEKILNLLKEYYNYNIINKKGINNLSLIDTLNNGCISISNNLDEKF